MPTVVLSISRFAPLRRHPSPERVAVLVMAAASEPVSGSVIPIVPTHSPSRIGGR